MAPDSLEHHRPYISLTGPLITLTSGSGFEPWLPGSPLTPAFAVLPPKLSPPHPSYLPLVFICSPSCFVRSPLMPLCSMFICEIRFLFILKCKLHGHFFVSFAQRCIPRTLCLTYVTGFQNSHGVYEHTDFSCPTGGSLHHTGMLFRGPLPTSAQREWSISPPSASHAFLEEQMQRRMSEHCVTVLCR